MIDLLISYLNFIILSIRFIVKFLAFRPPDPKGVRIKENKDSNDINENEFDNKNIEILFQVPVKKENKNNKTDETKKINSNIKKTPENNNEKIQKKLEYRPAENKYSNFELIFFDNKETNIKIPAFIFKPKEYYQFNCIIIYCHGNSGDIGTSFIECQILARNLGCNVLSFEYPGYGLSQDFNNTNEKRAYLYIQQAYKYARDELHYSPYDIFIYGFSLGTGIAFNLACDKDYPNGGVILQSPFLSITRIFYNFKKTYYFDIFNSCDKAKFCESTIFIIHGNKDTIVPYVHGRILAKLIPKKYLYGFYTVNDANHNDIIKFAKEQLYINIKTFLYEMYRRNQYHNSDPELDISSRKSENINTSSNRPKNKETDKKIEMDNNGFNLTSKNKLKEEEEKLYEKMKDEPKHELSNLFPKANDNDTFIDINNDNLDNNDIVIQVKEK